MPEVSLVAILDADKEGFSAVLRVADPDHGTRRPPRGRPRHSVRRRDDRQHAPALGETSRRRAVQLDYNERNGIVPQSIIKPIDMSLVAIAEADYVTVPLEDEQDVGELTPDERQKFIAELEGKMREAARRFEFEQAAQLRDRVKALKAV